METTETTMQTRTKMSTSMTDSGSVVRSNSNDFNPFHLCLVLDKVLQLVKTPVVNPIVHPSSTILFSDSFEIFHYNLVAFESSNNILTYVMINPSHPTSFSSRQLSKKPLTGMSAFSLEFFPQIPKLFFDLLNLCRIVKSIIRSDCKVVYSEVNTKNKLRSVVDSIDFFRECKKEESSALFVYTQKTFTDFPIKILFIALRNIKNKGLLDFKQSQDKSIPFDISISREIELNRSFAYYRFSFGFFDNSTSLFNTGNSKLRRKSLSERSVSKRVEFDIIFDFMFPSLIDTKLQTFSIDLDSSKNFRGCNNLGFSCNNTSHDDMDTEKIFKCIGGRGNFHPTYE